MKKLLKILLGVLASLFLFLSVNLSAPGDKAGVLKLSLNSQTTQAWDQRCWLNCAYYDCFCFFGCAACGGICPNGLDGSPCKTAIVE